jgi:hypothetical protein
MAAVSTQIDLSEPRGGQGSGRNPRALSTAIRKHHYFKVGQRLTLFQVGELRRLADSGFDVKVSLGGGGWKLDYLKRVL